MMSTAVCNEAYTDVVELCALLQCLGFSVKSLDTSDGNTSQGGGMRSVVINCQSSGLHVVLESPSLSCSCPTTTNQQNSSFWEVSGVTGGKQLDKEFGSTLLGSLPKSHRERISTELHEMIRCIKQHNESDAGFPKDAIANKSTSMLELTTPEKRDFPIKTDTPTRYRSLDTLTAAKRVDEQLPEPGPLHKIDLADASVVEEKNKKQRMYRRQSTYTLSSTPGSARRRNKTSSPIQTSQNTLLESLIAAEKAAEELHNNLANIIREYMEDGKHDSSMSSLALDVSKISVLKVIMPRNRQRKTEIGLYTEEQMRNALNMIAEGQNYKSRLKFNQDPVHHSAKCADSKAQFASSPNLSGISKEKVTTSWLKRFASASTSLLASDNSASAKENTSRLRRILPNIVKAKKEAPTIRTDKIKSQETRTKLNSTRQNVEASPNLISTRKKFSHVKSTIPRPPPTKKE